MRFVRITLLMLCLLVAPVPGMGGSLPAKSPSGTAVIPADVVVAGWVEQVLIGPPGEGDSVRIRAKLDTGALTSSLHAEDVRVEKEAGVVHFVFVSDDGNRVPMTCPYIRTVRIKRRPEGFLRRPVVGMRLQLGTKEFLTEMNLADRSHFNYELLIGRRDLENGIWVDASRKNLLPLPRSGK
ncbi:MAG: RimK/LysX family protein [Desulfovibrio sp.]|nr:RimK/LysX family protein [Desulfovibrio sp.]